MVKKLVGFFLLLCTGILHAAEGPIVVASILPVYHIAQAVMGKLGHVVLLVPQGASEHAYALKPSQYEAISEADVVIWIGPHLETYLVDALAKVPAQKQMTLIDDKAMIRHNVRGDDHHGSLDPHLWLDPLNAIRLATQLEKRLSALDPDNKKRYRQQMQAFVSTVSTLNLALDKQLSPVKSVPFVTFHDAFQYFEKRYGLRRLDSVSNNPHVSMSATRWIEMALLLKSEHIHCIFSEPQNQTDLLKQLAADNQAQLGTLDPIGDSLPSGTDGYVALLTGIADSMSACLSKKR